MTTLKVCITFIMFTLIAYPSASKAAEPNSFPICKWTGEQLCPAVSGNYVVWQDRHFGTYDIYRNNGVDMNDANSFLVCNAGNDQINPAISGTNIVWQDYRPSTSNCDIYRYLLPTGPENSVCTLTSKQRNPAISGSIIVWQDNRSSGIDDIYGYSLTAGEFVICDSTGAQSYPAISGNMVVWQDARNGGDMDIYRKNISTGEEFDVCLVGTWQQKPAISENIVVWQDLRNGDNDIYGKNISTGEEIEICKYAGKEQINPAISGDIVVWEDQRGSNSDIYGYRISTHTVFPICTFIGDQKNPSIDGDFVVWEDYRNDASGDIYGAYIPTPIAPSFLTVLNPNGGEMLLAGSGCTITWQTTGTPIARVKLEYSTNGGTAYSIIDANTANTGTYLWQTPQAIDSNQCRIKITDTAIPSAASDTSNYVFTIFACDESLTADLSGDCKVDFADFALFSGQWLTCGNPRDLNWCP
ncbi:MAG: TolB family protein [Sedimentisphaerales bacterium]